MCKVTVEILVEYLGTFFFALQVTGIFSQSWLMAFSKITQWMFCQYVTVTFQENVIFILIVSIEFCYVAFEVL